MRQNLLATAALAATVTACAAPMPDIRMIERPLSSANLGANDRIAEGNAMMRLGNVGLAIEAYRRARRADPQNPDVYVMLAAAYDRMGRTDLASGHYQQAMALAPHRPDLYVALADTLSRQNRTDEARAVLAEASRRREMIEAEVVANTTVDIEARLAARIDDQERLAARALERDLIRTPAAKRSGPRLEKVGVGATMLVTRDEPVWAERERSAPAIALSAPQASNPVVARSTEPAPTPVPRPVRAVADAVVSRSVSAPAPLSPVRSERIASIPTMPVDAPLAVEPVAPTAVAVVEVASIAEIAAPSAAPSSRLAAIEPTHRAANATVGTLAMSSLAAVSGDLDMIDMPAGLERLLTTVTIDDDVIAMLLDEGWIDAADVADLRLAEASRADIVPALHGIALCNK